MFIKVLTFFAALLALASGACILQKTPTMADDELMVMCLKVKDLKSEMMKIPTDKTIVNMMIVESNIPKIETGTFERFGTKLKKLDIVHCRVNEIEDHAFRGLTELKSLVVKNNKLEVIKVSWIEDLTSLTELNLHGNMIKMIEPGFSEKLPKLMDLNMEYNEMLCLNLEKLSTLKNLKMLKVGFNPLSWKCIVDLADWRKGHPSVKGEMTFVEDFNINKMIEVVRECLKTTPGDGTTKAMDTCMETKMHHVITK